ncbi:MAG: MgtC/SapB family protein [Cyanobium sp.]|jgi:putative Mg2+ transporter-C (MgtC) family protein|nr:MgtC/SapB family protein [Synechococcaceae cyanobacterium]
MPTVTPELEALLRMGLAVLCGVAVGLNRAHHGATPHPNRLRVHVLVGLSACLMVLAAGPDAQARSRAIQGVAAGVGFLGAGEILVPTRPSKQKPLEVRGLSSAASIWFTASLGVTVAASSPVLGLVALVLALITLSDRRLLGRDNPESEEPPPRLGGGSQPSSSRLANTHKDHGDGERQRKRNGQDKH